MSGKVLIEHSFLRPNGRGRIFWPGACGGLQGGRGKHGGARVPVQGPHLGCPAGWDSRAASRPSHSELHLLLPKPLSPSRCPLLWIVLSPLVSPPEVDSRDHVQVPHSVSIPNTSPAQSQALL